MVEGEIPCQFLKRRTAGFRLPAGMAAALVFLAAHASFFSAFASPAGIQTSAESAVLIEAETGTALYEKDPDRQMGIASTTKIMTALVALERCDLQEKVVIEDGFKGVEGSSMYLKPGEELTVLELLYGLMLASGNDAAVALARHVSGGEEEFCRLMNERAAALGCLSTHFSNPHGLDAENHRSTARDLAAIAREAMKNRTFCDIVSTKYASVAGRRLKNHNKLLWSCPGAIGIKTGYTKSAGRCLVSAAERGGMRLICVTLSDPRDWEDHARLYDWAFGEFSLVRVGSAQSLKVPVVSGTKESAFIRPAEDFAAVYSKSDAAEVRWEAPRFVYAPVRRGDAIGSVLVLKNGEAVKKIPLICTEDVPLDPSVPLGFLERLIRALTGGG